MERRKVKNGEKSSSRRFSRPFRLSSSPLSAPGSPRMRGNVIAFNHILSIMFAPISDRQPGSGSLQKNKMHI